MGKFSQVNGIRLHYLDHAGGDPVVVLLPGLTANAQSFDGLIGAGLCPAHRVLALDLRGRGLSDKPPSGYSLAAHAADVIGLLDALQLERVVLGGHSFGGLLSFYLAANFAGSNRSPAGARRRRVDAPADAQHDPAIDRPSRPDAALLG